jgi:hypothetical protein
MNKERLGSLILFFVGMYAFFSSVKLPIGTWREPGAGLFPLIISILLCFVSVLVFISEKKKGGIDWRGFTKQSMKPWQIVLLTSGFIFTMGQLGFLVTSSLYLFGLFLWVCRFRFWFSFLFSMLLAPATWYFFGNILGLLLPIGPWGF